MKLEYKVVLCFVALSIAEYFKLNVVVLTGCISLGIFIFYKLVTPVAQWVKYGPSEQERWNERIKEKSKRC